MERVFFDYAIPQVDVGPTIELPPPQGRAPFSIAVPSFHDLVACACGSGSMFSVWREFGLTRSIKEAL